MAEIPTKQGEQVGEETFFVESIVSSETKKGLVNFHWGEKDAQMDIATALKIAHDILECCESALSDQICFEFGKTVNDESVGVALIMFFREQRLKWLKENPRQ